MTLQRPSGVRSGAPEEEIEPRHTMTRAFFRSHIAVPIWNTSCSCSRRSSCRRRRNILGHIGPRARK